MTPLPTKAGEKTAAKADARLVAAYRDGLSLVAIAAVRCNGGLRVVSGTDSAEFGPETAATLRWCRNAGEARRVAASANASLRRWAGKGDPTALAQDAMAQDAMARAAKRLNVTLRTEDDIAAEAAIVIGRVVREFEQMRASGDLREVNASYRDYRLDASSRGERIVPYAQWMRVYLEGLVRQAAVTLRNL